MFIIQVPASATDNLRSTALSWILTDVSENGSDDGISKLLWNVCHYLSEYTALQLRRQPCSHQRINRFQYSLACT
jgi:hypothetical protein